jgi:hypothetical protein
MHFLSGAPMHFCSGVDTDHSQMAQVLSRSYDDRFDEHNCGAVARGSDGDGDAGNKVRP